MRHSTIQINHQPDATILQFMILTFIYSSTCFGGSPAHHQELNDCSSSLWFYLRIVVIAVLCSWSCQLFIYIYIFIHTHIYIYIYIYIYIGRSQWPRGLRCRSAADPLLRSWVGIQPGAWMFVCCECCVLSGRGLCDELITRPEESYRLCCVVVCDLETSKMTRP